MPTAETLRALLALVEEAKAGSRELDAELWWALGDEHPKGFSPFEKQVAQSSVCLALDIWFGPAWGCDEDVPPFYTTSIDAALALVGKVPPGQDFTLHSQGIGSIQGEATARIRFAPLTSVEETAPTLPLAILAALLRALLQQSETSHVER